MNQPDYSEEPIEVIVDDGYALISNLGQGVEYAVTVSSICGTCDAENPYSIVVQTSVCNIPDLEFEFIPSACDILIAWPAYDNAYGYYVSIRNVTQDTGSAQVQFNPNGGNDDSHYVGDPVVGDIYEVKLRGKCNNETCFDYEVISTETFVFQEFDFTCEPPANLDVNYSNTGGFFSQVINNSWELPYGESHTEYSYWDYDDEVWSDPINVWDEDWNHYSAFINTDETYACMKFRVRTFCECFDVESSSDWVEYEECPVCTTPELLGVYDNCTNEIYIEYLPGVLVEEMEVELFIDGAWEVVPYDLDQEVFTATQEHILFM